MNDIEVTKQIRVRLKQAQLKQRDIDDATKWVRQQTKQGNNGVNLLERNTQPSEWQAS